MSYRIQVKFFLENAETLDLAPISGVFQRWIQQHVLEGLLIDVADYRHVFEGPGVVLIGHESDYSLERRNGRLGLLYTRKRDHAADLPGQLRTALRLALAACRLLEAEKALGSRLRFHAGEIEFRFTDRLQFPNVPETFEQISPAVNTVLAELYGSDQFSVAQRSGDPRDMLTLDVHGAGAENVASLLLRLESNMESQKANR